jgi:biotin transport system ATP-binding protein
MEIIEIENLSHVFPDGRLGIDNLSLSIPEGAFVVVAGANGSGKSTLLRHINGLLTPTGGMVRVAGMDVSKQGADVRLLVQMVFQSADSQIVGETVYDDVAFGPENIRVERAQIRQRVRAALTQVGLEHLSQQQTHLLSGGEKRRLTIAGVLAMRPRIILMDEPFANLDFPGIRQILQQILNIHRQGTTLILCSHELDPVAAHADRIVVLEQGRLVLEGSPEKVIERLEVFGVRAPCGCHRKFYLEPQSCPT